MDKVQSIIRGNQEDFTHLFKSYYVLLYIIVYSLITLKYTAPFLVMVRYNFKQNIKYDNIFY